MKVFYERVLDISKLLGRKDCKIIYVNRLDSNSSDILREALFRGIILERVSERDFATYSKQKKTSIETLTIDEMIDLFEKANFYIDFHLGRTNGKHSFSKLEIALKQLPAELKRLKLYDESQHILK